MATFYEVEFEKGMNLVPLSATHGTKLCPCNTFALMYVLAHFKKTTMLKI